MVLASDSNLSTRSSKSRQSFGDAGEEEIIDSGRRESPMKIQRSLTNGSESRISTNFNTKSGESSVTDALMVNMVSNSGNDIELQVRPSTLEVDYDTNITVLYQAITDSNWKAAVKAAKEKPEDARTWVVRHYQEDDETEDLHKDKEIMWRFLPIHSASARQPPEEVIGALLHAYPDGARCVDDQGMFALHYACGNQASCEVIRMLLSSFPNAAHMHDPNGMLPIHYLACWGPSSMPVVDMVLVANRDAVNAKDAEGNTPLDLALDGEYPDRDRVVTVLRQWASNVSDSRSVSNQNSSQTGNSSVASIRFAKQPTTISLVDHEDDDTAQEHREPTPQSIPRTNSYSRDTPTRREQRADKERETPRKEDSDGSDSPSTPFLVSRLKDEISSLKNKLKESKWELQAQKGGEGQSQKERIAQLERKCERQQEELEITREELDEVQGDLEKKEDECYMYRKELKEKESKLKDALNERKGLRLTLTDLMEQHEKFKRKADHMNDRLGSLSASLASMIEQHKTVLRAMQQREEAWRQATSDRKAKLAELVMMEDEMEQDSSLEEALDKQNKEMEAIAAVIAVTRQ